MAGSLTGHRKYGEAASRYIENSVEENACTKELQKLHKMAACYCIYICECIFIGVHIYHVNGLSFYTAFAKIYRIG